MKQLFWHCWSECFGGGKELCRARMDGGSYFSWPCCQNKCRSFFHWNAAQWRSAAFENTGAQAPSSPFRLVMQRRRTVFPAVPKQRVSCLAWRNPFYYNDEDACRSKWSLIHMSSFLCLHPAFGSYCPPRCQGLFFNIDICCLGTGLGVLQFMTGPDQSLGRNISGGWMGGCDLGRRVWLFIILPLSWVSLCTCVILEFAYFP